MTDRFERLPKWAREKITQLHYRAMKSESMCAQLSASTFDGSGNVSIERFQEPNIILPDRANIRFGNQETWIETRYRDGVVEVMASSRVVISPQATNTFSVWVSDK